ncbi:uncharacterized protein LOC143058255 [Mytilus galloprovincialis]|uniref:uncharacterized protein LOC143058255 n=1 Tax=Mytilus galloprovincialis TaxID=29158 RepID=UPI003F7B3E5B
MCQSRCFNITCYNKGFCILDISGNPVCQCKRDGKYVFAGDFCGTKGERLLLASEYIIAAACGSGGIIIIVAIVICFICKGRTPKDKNEKDYYIADQATLSYNHPMGLFGRQRIPSNMYFSMRDSTYNDDDRRYTVIEDLTSKRGNTYIYNPASEPSANTDTDNRSDHVYYNKSFCSEEFAIKRPHVRTERDSFRSDYNRPKIHRPDYM